MRIADDESASSPTARPRRVPRRVRSIFISDVHLGTPDCNARFLADFLIHHHCERLYLVGDIVDGWRLKRSWYWNEEHSAVVDLILAAVQRGTEVIYIPGNHDEALRPYVGQELAGVRLLSDTIHETADGRRFLVIHGDAYDGMCTRARLAAWAGEAVYVVSLTANTWLARTRRALGLPYWSVSTYLKRRLMRASAFIMRYEEELAREARRRGADGVICGHIHHAALREIEGVVYINDGDWVESCTALVEEFDGAFELLHWSDREVSLPEAVLAPASVG